MRAREFRELSDAELRARVSELRQELFNLRFQKARGQLANTARLRSARRDLARALTILAERTRSAGEAGKGAGE